MDYRRARVGEPDVTLRDMVLIFRYDVGPEEEFRWDHAAVSSIFTVYMVAIGATGPLVCRWIDKFGIRAVLASGSLVLSLGLIISTLPTQWSISTYFSVSLQVSVPVLEDWPAILLLLKTGLWNDADYLLG